MSDRRASVNERPLRRDAAENRSRLLEAAADVFAEQGLDASVEEIAREAGVGMGTLYRRFSTKQALVDELVGGLRRELLEIARAALRRSDGSGLEYLLTGVGELQAGQSGCVDRLWNHSDAELDALREFRRLAAALLGSAQQAGRIRADVTATDLTMVMWSLRGIIQMTRSEAPGAWRRHLDLLLAGLRDTAAEPLSHAALTEAQARRITAQN
jgi:AcrR family transcriptional regulator